MLTNVVTKIARASIEEKAISGYILLFLCDSPVA